MTTPNELQAFINNQPVATLSTVGPDTTPYAAVVYVFFENEQIFFLTKRDTQKFRNITMNPTVAVTSFRENELETLQVIGQAYEVEDKDAKDAVKRQLARLHGPSKGVLPPIMQLEAGEYVVVGIDPVSSRVGRFVRKDDEQVFTDIA